MSSNAFAKLYSESRCTIDFIYFLKTYKFYNATLIVNIFQFIVASIRHYCSLHRNAQSALCLFGLKLKIEVLTATPLSLSVSDSDTMSTTPAERTAVDVSHHVLFQEAHLRVLFLYI